MEVRTYGKNEADQVLSKFLKAIKAWLEILGSFHLYREPNFKCLYIDLFS